MLIDAGAEVAITGRDQSKIASALAHLGEQATGAAVDATSPPQVLVNALKGESYTHLVKDELTGFHQGINSDRSDHEDKEE
jgi:hypothetical protein